MKKILCAVVVVLLAAGIAWAGSLTYTWTAPTTNIDGSPLPLSAIGMYQIGYGPASRGTNPAFPYPNAVNVPNPMTPTVTHIVTSLPSATYYSSVRVVAVDGGVSDWSMEVSKYVANTPSTVMNLSIVTGFGVQL